MVSSEQQAGLYVTIPLYFLVLAGCALWANRRNRKEVEESLNGNGHHHTDQLSSHYLGGRNIGPILSSGTIFASFYSGYTVVGIPTEAFKNGYLAFRWVAMALTVLTGMSGTVLRLRKAALVRNHKTPVDFICDRFQSQLLRYTIVVLQIIPSLFYTTAQVIALKSTCNNIFGLDPDTIYPVLIIMTVTLLFEWIGGLRCVAMTDCIQASIMVVAYICLPIIIRKNFGGWAELDPTTYPRPDFYQTPSWDEQLDFWQFAMSTFTFFTLPHLMQRAYAASDLSSLKAAYVTMSIGMWLLMFGGVFIGTVGVSILADKEGPILNPLTEILGEVMALGNFPLVVGLVAITASLAAIMSTVDSLLVAMSQIFTEEIAYPMYPTATPREMAWIGRVVSFVAVFIATTLGLTWDDGITHLANINFQLSFQTLFIFMIGLFGTSRYDCHPWNLAFCAMSSSIYIFVIYFQHIRNCTECGALNAGVTGILLQMGILVFLEVGRRFFFPEAKHHEDIDMPSALIFPNRPKWDIPKRARFGEKPLTPKLLWKMMEGVDEPLANPWYSTLMFLAITMITPFMAPDLPTDMQDLPEATVNGLPWWAVRMFVSALIPTFFLTISLFRMPRQYTLPMPDDSTPITTRTESTEQSLESPFSHHHLRRRSQHGTGYINVPQVIDPDVMEMTPEELGHRTSYDGRNELVYRRRMQILEKLGISPAEINSVLGMTQESQDLPQCNTNSPQETTGTVALVSPLGEDGADDSGGEVQYVHVGNVEQ